MLKTKAKMRLEMFTPSNWSNREKEAQETGWARFIFNKQKPKNEQPKEALGARTETMAATAATNAP